MKSLIGGLLTPYFPELVTDANRMKTCSMQSIAAELDRAACLLKEKNPQTIVLLAPNGAVIEDAVGLYAHPRLKGALTNFQLPDMMLGFETDSLLMKLISKQSHRLGVPMEELTDDVLEERRLSAKLGDEALAPLYYLQRSGFKGQIVNLSYGKLPYEEMYTLGKAVRLAAEKSSKSTAVVVAATPPFSACESEAGRAIDGRLLDAVKALDVKALLEMDKGALDINGVNQLRPFFFLLGALVGTAYEDKVVFLQEVNGRIQAVGRFL